MLLAFAGCFHRLHELARSVRLCFSLRKKQEDSQALARSDNIQPSDWLKFRNNSRIQAKERQNGMRHQRCPKWRGQSGNTICGV